MPNAVLAKTMVVFMVRGLLNKLQFPYAQFPCGQLDQLYDRVCNRLSGYSGYSDIRKNLSVRIATKHYSEKSISEFYLFEITGF